MSRGLAIASPPADDPPTNRTDWRKPESQIARKPTTNTPFLANSTTSAPPFRYTVQRLSRSSRTTRQFERDRADLQRKLDQLVSGQLRTGAWRGVNSPMVDTTA